MTMTVAVWVFRQVSYFVSTFTGTPWNPMEPHGTPWISGEKQWKTWLFKKLNTFSKCWCCFSAVSQLRFRLRVPTAQVAQVAHCERMEPCCEVLHRCWMRCCQRRWKKARWHGGTVARSDVYWPCWPCFFFGTTWMSPVGKCLVNATDPAMFHLYPLPSEMGLFHTQHFLMSSTTSTPKPRCDTTSGSMRLTLMFFYVSNSVSHDFKWPLKRGFSSRFSSPIFATNP